MFRNMKYRKELAKNAVLALLICSSLLLFFRIWYVEKLWPGGYNFFANWGIGRILSYSGSSWQDNKNTDITAQSMMGPSTIIFQSGGKRYTIGRNDALYTPVSEDVTKAIGGILNAEKPQIMPNTNEWFDALKGKSIYIKYGNNYDADLWLKSTGLSFEAFAMVETVRDIILLPKDSGSQWPVMYVRTENSEIYKILYPELSSVIPDIIQKYTAVLPARNALFSFELGVDKIRNTPNDGIALKVLVEPHLLVELSEALVFKISTSLPDALKKQQSVDVIYLENILNTFGFKQGAVQHYVEADNTILFVDNYATLKLYPAGIIQYEAIEDDKGLELFKYNGEPSTAFFVNTLLSSAQFASAVMKVTETTGAQIYLESDITKKNSNGRFDLAFGYYVSGRPVIFSQDEMSTYGIELSVVNGRLKKYKQHIRKFTVLDQPNKVKPMIMALDEVYKELFSANTKAMVDDIYIAYVDHEQQVSPMWVADIENQMGMVKINGEYTLNQQ